MPILIHGGRGLPPIAAHLEALVRRCAGVQLIVAHAGIADMANLTSRFAGYPGVYFDTSTWSPVDLLDFYRQMPPEQIVYASDYPYGRQPTSLLMAVRTARLAGFDADEVRGMLSDNASRIADGEEPPEPSQPKGGDIFSQPTLFARIHQYLSMATPMMWTRQPDTIGVLGLALNTCEGPLGRLPRADGADPGADLHGAGALRRGAEDRGRRGAPTGRAVRVSAHPPRGHPGGDRTCLS